MKTIITFSIAIVLSICQVTAQSFNLEISENDKTSLQGKINKEGLSQAPYGDWFTKNYEAYNPDAQTVNAIKSELDGITLTAFMGTWCGDSKKEVPKFYKLLDEANFPLERLTMIGVSRERDTYKQSPGGEEEGLNIHRVPTFIFYKDGKEINRIVEHPVGQLDNDILAALSGEHATSYPVVDYVSEQLSDLGVEKFTRKLKKIASKATPLAKEKWDLNTYSFTMMMAGKEGEAIAVAKLNTLLFPGDAYVHSSLGAKYKQMGQTTLAKEAYQKALQLDPKNEQAMKALTVINNGA